MTEPTKEYPHHSELRKELLRVRAQAWKASLKKPLPETETEIKAELNNLMIQIHQIKVSIRQSRAVWKRLTHVAEEIEKRKLRLEALIHPIINCNGKSWRDVWMEKWLTLPPEEQMPALEELRKLDEKMKKRPDLYRED